MTDIARNLSLLEERVNAAVPAFASRRVAADVFLSTASRQTDMAYLRGVLRSAKRAIQLSESISGQRKKQIRTRLDACDRALFRWGSSLRLSLLFLAALLNLIAELRYLFKLAGPRELALRKAQQAGRELLPDYGDLTLAALQTLLDIITQGGEYSILADLLQGATYVEKYPSTRPVEDFCSKAEASEALDCAGIAYGRGAAGISYLPLPDKDVPEELRPVYDLRTGLIDLPNGIQVWCGGGERGLILAFAGTRLDSPGTVLADLEQLCLPSLHYLTAVGILRLFSMRGQNRIIVCGHSLGGGLAQFAIAAQPRIKHLLGLGFNSAGLSMTTLSSLDKDRLDAARNAILHYSTLLDPVSHVGGLLGRHALLPVSSERPPWHAWKDVRACMDVYLHQKEEGQKANTAGDLSIQARGLHSPGYMGLPDARHIYLTSPDERGMSWGCFGRGYTPGDASELVYSGTVLRQWILELDPYTHASGNNPGWQAGVANTVNGTCHTLANRLLLTAYDAKADVSASIDDAYSVAVFGKYGCGLLQAMRLLNESFVRASEQTSLPNNALLNAQNRLWTPYKDELNAWVRVVDACLGISIQPFLDANSDVASTALGIVTAYSAARNAAYERIVDPASTEPPSREAAQEFLLDLKVLTKKYTHALLDACGLLGILPKASVATIEAFLDQFIDRGGNSAMH